MNKKYLKKQVSYPKPPPPNCRLTLGTSLTALRPFDTGLTFNDDSTKISSNPVFAPSIAPTFLSINRNNF